jgi:hypothetical protein
MAKEKMQMVDDDEIENVGIMSGFLDDIDDLMEEIEKEGQVEEGDDADMARILDRRPDSPEILMNNLRGDYRSIDARREELADRVGYNAAQQTPDEVLAMLQPIFAQQGIGALPMGGADVGALPMDAMTGMPPPGGMPPMDPAMMGMPPPAAQPMMDMPPEMMGMAPEGIASLPAEMPMQMARGGIVQRFQQGGGVGEDGDIPSIYQPSSTTTVTREFRDRAQNEVLDIMNQRPYDVPSLQESMESRIPLYESVLGGTNKQDMQSGMLFDIAQAALGYAGNVGPQGQPLRGSAASRLGAAFSAVPGQMGARSAAQQQQAQAVRLAALQAAEKDIQSVQEANLKLDQDRRDLVGKIATSTTTDSNIFGSGIQGRALSIVTNNHQAYRDGTLSPEEVSAFESAAQYLLTPSQHTDPLTGNIVLRPGGLPPLVREAIDQVGRFGDQTSSRNLTSEPAPSLNQNSISPEVRSALSVRPIEDNYNIPESRSLFNIADATGPLNAFKGLLFSTPVFNLLSTDDAPEIANKKAYVEAAKNFVVTAFQAGTAEFGNREREQLLNDIDAALAVIDTPDAYRERVYALDDRLQQLQSQNLAIYNDRNQTVADQRKAMERLNVIHETRVLVGVPLNAQNGNDPRLKQIILNNPVGTPFGIRYTTEGGGNQGVYQVTEEMKNRFAPPGAL